MLMCERTSVSLSTHSYVCTCVRARSRCTVLKNVSLSVYYSYVSTKKERSSNYFREIIIQSRNFSTRIHYVIDSFRIRLNRDSMRKKSKEEKHGQIDFSLRHVEIFGHLPTYLSTPFTDSFRYIFVYNPPSRDYKCTGRHGNWAQKNIIRRLDPHRFNRNRMKNKNSFD